ncbi:phosphotransferase enzyme family domain-containing protein [Trichoderma breve]|uniref:Phosphotransferase enzyme family domain-containing protein n=1 Tax=Trichoderma breve TaxID=2034170 RepID=A0A9W9E1T8_9HYPO|nr:phosphotransferase enzyme family domain-containing protein [Trichoderma breve]KAJ4855033.1 phosphotransferase enzyme family domain-containing protein [Trichoderma breve]
MSEGLLTKDEGVKALMAYVNSGSAIGPVGKGKGVGYSLMKSSPTSFSWSTAIEDFEGSDTPVDRYLIKIDRRTKEFSTLEPIVLSERELADAVLAATGQHLSSWTRFADGSMSISYKVTVKEDPDVAYVVQIRHYASVASMDAFMTLISRTISPSVLPIPPVYPIPGELAKWFLPIYAGLSHEERLIFVQNLALAFSACWEIQLPEPRLIGELIASNVDGHITLRVRPDRQNGLGGPFHSVRDYLRAYIKCCLVLLENQQGIEEYKEKYLHRIRDFVNTRLHEIPAVVETVPIVGMHADMGPHNIIVSNQTPTEIQAIIDWEFLESAPYASLCREMEMFFRELAPNGFGPEYERADELREAFWSSIPNWKRWNESEATQTFLEWFRFGLFMKPEYRPKELIDEERDKFWVENIRVVESMLELNEASNA